MRRAAFDIGSGATKLVIADVANSMVRKQLFGKELPVPFGTAWKQSKDNSLSEEVQTRGLEALRGLIDECEKHDVPLFARCAIATEVFRKASNGQMYLERVKKHIRSECADIDPRTRGGCWI